MKVATESQPDFSVLLYSGTHACSDADHKQDERVRKYVEACVRAGQNQFLVDVRDLHVVFGSGIADLLNSWTPISGDGGVRIAILWKPSHARLDRWALLDAEFEKAVATGGWVQYVHQAAGTRSGMRLFVDEDRARAILLDKRIGRSHGISTGPLASPTGFEPVLPP